MSYTSCSTPSPSRIAARCARKAKAYWMHLSGVASWSEEVTSILETLRTARLATREAEGAQADGRRDGPGDLRPSLPCRDARNSRGDAYSEPPMSGRKRPFPCPHCGRRHKEAKPCEPAPVPERIRQRGHTIMVDPLYRGSKGRR